MTKAGAIFLQGLVALLPLTVTVILLFWFGATAERMLGAGIKRVVPEEWYVSGMGVAAGLSLTFVLGLLVNIWGAPQFIRFGENLIGHIPLVKTIYGAVRDLLGFFGKTGGLGAKSSVVLVSLGESGVQVVGLMTRERFDDLPPGLGGEGFVAVYVPFSYQIGGSTIIVPRERVRPIDMPLEDAMRFIVTAGVKAEEAEALPIPSSSVETLKWSRSPEVAETMCPPLIGATARSALVSVRGPK